MRTVLKNRVLLWLICRTDKVLVVLSIRLSVK